MSIFDKLESVGKSIGILEDVPDNKANSAQKAAPAAPAQAMVNQGVVAPQAIVPGVVQATSPAQATPVIVLSSDDSEFASLLQDALKNASTDNMDFYKFLCSVKALEKNIPDEASRYSTAFAVSSATSGVTPESILASYQKFASCLDAEKIEFNSACIGGYKQNADKVSSEITSITSEMESISAQIMELTEKQNTLVASRLSKNNELTSINEKIEVETRNFESAFYKETVKLSNHKANIEKYLLPKA